MQIRIERIAHLAVVGAIALTIPFVSAGARPAPGRTVANADITGTVTDSASGQPLSSAEVSVMRGTEIVFNASTDAFGRYTAHNLAPGSYTVSARFLGFRRLFKDIVVGETTGDIRVDFALTPV